MEIEVIETKIISYSVEVNSNWPSETQNNPDKAKAHLVEAINNVGFEPINKVLKGTRHTLTIDGEDF